MRLVSFVSSSEFEPVHRLHTVRALLGHLNVGNHAQHGAPNDRIGAEEFAEEQ